MRCATCGSPLPERAAYCPRCSAPVRGAEECSDYAYEAFISYRHVPEDRAVARRVQRRVEGYRVPAGLEGATGRRRLGKCFRDEDELPTSDSLPCLIEDALRRSRFLVVVCSPRMRESRWVAREVELFSAYHGRDHVLLALAEGEPAEAFPPLLMSLAERDGEAVVERETEPVAADMRRSSHKRFSDEVLRILAPIVECGYDDLRQRSRARRLRGVAAAACVAAALGVTFGSFALFQQAQIQENYESALRNQSEYLAEEAMTLLEQGDRMQAVQVALHALGEDGGGERPYVPSARLALEQACQVYPDQYWRPCYSNVEEAGIDSTSISVSADGSMYAVITSDRVIRVYDVSSGAAVREIPPPTYELMESEEQVGWRSDARFVGNVIVSLDGTPDFDGIVGYDPSTGEELYRTSFENDALQLFPSPDGTLVAATESVLFGRTGGLTICDARSGAVVFEAADCLEEPATADELTLSTESIAGSFSENAALFAISSGSGVTLFDTASGEQRTIEVEGTVSSLLTTNAAVFVGTSIVRDGVAQGLVSAYDPRTLELLWSYGQEASRHLDTVDAPRILEVTSVRDGALLAAIGTEAHFFSLATGEIITTIYSQSNIDLAHLFDEGDNVGLAYAGGETLRTVSNLAISEEGTPVVDAALSSSFIGGSDPDVSGSAVKFFVSDEGECVCLLTLDTTENRSDRSGTLLFRYDRHNTCPGRASMDDEDVAMKLVTSSTLRSTEGGYLAVSDYETHDILVFDGATFDLLWTIDLSEAGGDAPPDETAHLFFSPEEDSVLYAYVDDANRENTLLYALDAESGKTFASTTIPDTYTEEGCFEVRDGCVRCLVGEWDEESLEQNYYLVTTDALTLEETSRVQLDVREEARFLSTERMCTTGTTLLVDSNVGVETYDLETGKAIDCGCRGTVLTGSSDTQLVTNSEHTRLLAATTGGVVAFDASGNELWSFATTSRAYSDPYATLLPTEDVLLREESGQCLLLDGSDGTLLASSQMTIAPIYASWPSADGTRLFLSTSEGVSAISLDSSSFGVESLLPLAGVVTQDETRALFADYRNAYTLPLYTTDELVAYARELVEGHELTEAERRIYHLE